MKSILLAAALAVGVAGMTVAAPIARISQVTVVIGPALEAKADTYGQRDVDQLAVDLRKAVEGALARSGARGEGGAKLELVLADATPNRPTFKQLGANTDLSFRSFGIGGAKIEGALVFPDGASQPVKFQWRPVDIRDVRGAGTWSDAYWAFDQFANRAARGELYAAR